jgi:hypothetical protein
MPTSSPSFATIEIEIEIEIEIVHLFFDVIGLN